MRVLVALLFVAAGLAGCLGGDAPGPDGPQEPPGVTSVHERRSMAFNTSGAWSQTLQAGPHAVLEATQHFVPVALPPTEGAAAVDPQGTMVSIGLWMPDVPEGTQVPVVADIGPYYANTGGMNANEPDLPVTEWSDRRLGGFLIDNYVPHGYAVALVSVVGTGDSGGCMDMQGTAEQLGVDAAVEWLGTQDWSNGNVGLIGRSYDGTTPWEAATFGNPHLKTIVPISGLVGWTDLVVRNGSMEARGFLAHNFPTLYGLYAIDGDAADLHNVCPDYFTNLASAAAAYSTGDPYADPAGYWAERTFLQGALENYDGSIYLIHGMQDWNVHNAMAFPVHQLFEQKGNDVKGLYGQWDHAYPDRPTDHSDLRPGYGGEAYPESVRYDWAQDLLEWFDHYLMGTGPRPMLHAEIQDNQGAWRVEATYPPLDAAWMDLALGDAELSDERGQQLGGPTVGQGQGVTYVLPPLSETDDTLIAGMPQLRLGVVPQGPGGQVFVQMRDAESGLRLGHAVMDVRYHAGGQEMQTVTPGQSVELQMEFLALDAVLPAGHGIELYFANAGDKYLPPATNNPVVLEPETSTLLLPTVERAPSAYFLPPAWEETAEAEDA